MQVQEIRKVVVIGAGLMGAGIAEVFARAGHEVNMVDVEQRFLDKGMLAIQNSLKKAVERGKATEDDANSASKRIHPMLSLKSASQDIQFAVEAVIENAELKNKIFKELDENAPKEAILASNTSSISITAMGSATRRPDKVIGMHFFNPPPVMKLIEIIRGAGTSEETFKLTQELSQKLGKTAVDVQEAPGFVVNRALVPFLNEAVFLVHEGISSPKDIDTAIKLGLNHPMGPLELLDFVGLDTTLYILDYMFDETKDPKFRACPLLRKMVRAGYWGRKTGKGFYDYSAK